MKHVSLAARYRPQTFAEVAGQEMVTTVLSRAAAQDSVAPAYLLSGTRGVGKTTIARILAKALNCEHAPGPEPCNQCEQCRKITQGCHVDVTEIDGASNNSVEDARALRENIGYAPMEGRYKVFIIDEAHMLSPSAFNALLKTLEEPPPRVVFVFATTEAHKFPITIVSRCQHFVFKRLPETVLKAHLTRVLQAEGIPFEAGAVSLLARRAAGSVRDGMSLLGQTLALSDNSLTLANTQKVLGLAGQELFVRLLDALADQDCVAITVLVRELLDQGVDIGFFLRELVSLCRTLFLLRQAGDAIVPVLDLSADEVCQWKAQAPRFSLTHIHAAWQMVLEAQRRIIQSPEPAAALELLLLQLALLPRLLPLDRLPLENTSTAGTVGNRGGEVPRLPSSAPAAGKSGGTEEKVRERREDASEAVAATVPQMGRKTGNSRPGEASQQGDRMPPSLSQSLECSGEEEPPLPDDDMFVPSDSDRLLEQETVQKPGSRQTANPLRSAQSSSASTPLPPDSAQEKDELLHRFCECCGREYALPAPLLRQVKLVLADGQIHFHPEGVLLQTQLTEHLHTLEQAARECFGPDTGVQIHAPQRVLKTQAELKEEFSSREELQQCRELLDATLVDVRSL